MVYSSVLSLLYLQIDLFYWQTHVKFDTIQLSKQTWLLYFVFCEWGVVIFNLSLFFSFYMINNNDFCIP